MYIFIQVYRKTFCNIGNINLKCKIIRGVEINIVYNDLIFVKTALKSC